MATLKRLSREGKREGEAVNEETQATKVVNHEGEVVNQETQATKVVNHETQERNLRRGMWSKMAQWFLLLKSDKLIYQIQYFQFSLIISSSFSS